jgi:lipopolysaccharide transport system ATP-binding protein
MNDPAIRVENLGKLYRIGSARERNKTLREAMTDMITAPWRSMRSKPHAPCSMPSSQGDDTIWALRNVSFEVKRGEVVGIIGRNGAGKSTLLKILSRITEPTEGRIVMHGRVGSLLEVGTGFHSELTGEENIYLSGTILGMSSREISNKFDEIVAFAEMEKFIHTPVKHYSSGMYMRLAFAVAAHLEPEILLVDEVLAVGDAAFQKKCLGKMGDVAKRGRTILFVSHNMVAVQSLCQKVILLDKGEMVQNGPANQIVSNYLRYSLTATQMDQVWENKEEAPGCEEVRLHRISIQLDDKNDNLITMETPFLVIIEYWNERPATCLHITLHVYNEQGIIAFTTFSCQEPGWNGKSLEIGLYRSHCRIPKNLLNSGQHSITVLVVRDLSKIIYTLEHAMVFEVVDSKNRIGGTFGREPGVVQPYLDWKTEYIWPSVRLRK